MEKSTKICIKPLHTPRLHIYEITHPPPFRIRAGEIQRRLGATLAMLFVDKSIIASGDGVGCASLLRSNLT